MIDVPKAEAEATDWGISLRDYIELKTKIFGSVDVFGDPELEDDELYEEWRGKVADVLIENGLTKKANRFLECCRFAHLYQCEGSEKHNLFSPIYCDLRYCPHCAPRQFARLIEKYEPVLRKVSANKRQGFRIREITLTTRNTGELTTSEIKTFNLNIKKLFKAALSELKGWGVIWCDEVGFNNTNLHAHALLYGPYIPQDRLVGLWRGISGNEVVFVKNAHRSGSKALVHMLKYVSKPPADDPARVGLLEVAFHGIRRIHALGVFYNFVGDDTDNESSKWTTCPHCGEHIIKVPGTTRIERAILSGRTFVGTKRTEWRKNWVS